MRVSDVIGGTTTALITAAPRDTIADVVDLLKEYRIGAVVVTNADRLIVGILSERDIVRHLAREQEGTLRLKVEDLMTTTVTTCRPDEDVDAAMTTMTAGRFRHMPIVDELGKADGIVSMGDLVKARLGELEGEVLELREYIGPI